VNRKFWAGLLIGVGVIIILLFGFRLAHIIRRGALPPHLQPMAASTDVTLIRDWMTVPYIARTYGLPDRALFEALNIPEKENRKKSLAEINEEYFPEEDGFVLARVQEAILAFQANAPLPPIAPTP